MLWLTLFFLLCSVASGKELNCDGIDYYERWSSKTDLKEYCWQCIIKNQQISANDREISINGILPNKTQVNINRVIFQGGNVTKMPKIFQKNTRKQIFQVRLERTNTPVLNSQFFGSSGTNLKYFASFGNKLSVESSAFHNCTNLEALSLNNNEISSIPAATFHGLHKLIWLDLSWNPLTVINTSWFQDLNNLEELHLYANQLEEIPEKSFENLTKIKTVDLHQNNIEIITRKTFQHNEQLQFIDLEGNHIKEIERRSFARHSKLTELNLNGNICINTKLINESSKKITDSLTACHKTACNIPVILNGRVISTEDNSTQFPGDSFETYKSVLVACDKTFNVFHEKEIQTANVCLESDWTLQEWPQCHRLCPRNGIIGQRIKASCNRHGREFPCSGHLLPGTKATIRCQIGYRWPKGTFNSELICQESGNWSHIAYECEGVDENVTEVLMQLEEKPKKGWLDTLKSYF